MLVQELGHQCVVRNCLADRISSTFGSNLVVPIIKTDFKCSCDNEVRYLDLTYFSELWCSKKQSGGCSKNIHISTSHII
jgi:hypothetical protein